MWWSLAGSEPLSYRNEDIEHHYLSQALPSTVVSSAANDTDASSSPSPPLSSIPSLSPSLLLQTQTLHVIVLLVDQECKQFEVLRMELDPSSPITVSEVLQQASSMAIHTTLQSQLYQGICCNDFGGQRLLGPTSPLSELQKVTIQQQDTSVASPSSQSLLGGGERGGGIQADGTLRTKPLLALAVPFNIKVDDFVQHARAILGHPIVIEEIRLRGIDTSGWDVECYGLDEESKTSTLDEEKNDEEEKEEIQQTSSATTAAHSLFVEKRTNLHHSTTTTKSMMMINSTSSSSNPSMIPTVPSSSSSSSQQQQHGSHGRRNEDEIKLLLLMMSPKCFELVNTRIHVKDARIDHVLELIPELAKQKSIRKQQYIGLCDYRHEQLLESSIKVQDIFSHLQLDDGSGNDRSGSSSSSNINMTGTTTTSTTSREVLVAFPLGLSVAECTKKARSILRKVIPKLQARGMDLADYDESATTTTTSHLLDKSSEVAGESSPTIVTPTVDGQNNQETSTVTPTVENSLGGSILDQITTQILPTKLQETPHHHGEEEKEEGKEALLAAVTTPIATLIPPSSLEVFATDLDYKVVAMDIAKLIETNENNPTDQQLGPLLVSFAWQSAFMYYNLSQRITLFGGQAQFQKELDPHGKLVAAQWLEPIYAKYQHQELSYADLYTLAGVTAVKLMGGPTIPWKCGRVDHLTTTTVTQRQGHDDRNKNQSRTSSRSSSRTGKADFRSVFYDMGFNDQEIVALSGATALLRCQSLTSSRSDSIKFNNNYFNALATLEESAGVPKELHGPRYIETPVGGRLKMVPSDLVLLQEEPLMKWVKVYGHDGDKFFQDFSSAFHRLEELGTHNLVSTHWS